ncbi:MAG TPA: RNA 2',3'-cyclic phosphodiesterase [Chloroflexi bacterium]|nr:RNA 2',3'-cyclic phosphodiesterase [Chloroflexota bacterium]HHW88916.1 RNA 2',3'-cyclic phosphodiesterase [Chloroflexota bacterium]
MRAFIAIAMPTPVQQRLLATQHRLAQHLQRQQLDRCVRWTAASNLHLTLRFLGEIDSAQQQALAQSLVYVAQRHARMMLFASGVGCFPSARRPSVIWCGVEGDVAALTGLQVAVESAARLAGLPADPKPFKPHLTIGRLQRHATPAQLQAVGAAVAQLAAAPTHAGDVAAVDELLLMRSELTPSGPIYTRLGVFALQPA